jgi:hypothetical protein
MSRPALERLRAVSRALILFTLAALLLAGLTSGDSL